MSVRKAAAIVDGSVRKVIANAERQTWLLRAGLAFVFVYAAVTGVVDPGHFEHYVPTFVRESVGPMFFLGCFGVYEILLAVALMIRRYTYVASLLAAVTLVGIVVLNVNEFGVLFRNIAIACAALALADQTREPRRARRAQVSSTRRRGSDERPADAPADAAGTSAAPSANGHVEPASTHRIRSSPPG